MTQEQRIAQYYRTGLWFLHAGRRADAALMAAVIRRYDPIHPLAARLRALLAGHVETGDADDAALVDDDTECRRDIVRWRG